MEETYLDKGTMTKLKEMIKGFLKSKKFHEKDMIAEIYNLYQDYLISEEQETELYKTIDPEEKYNDVSVYWYDEDRGCLPLYECAITA